ncbi:ankyrin repeat domain-containing protein [Varunaivibrio sulfuroxidans]|nr:ankyrin repeat domain-containing protein [Varunaivibrio sulfuroxidans]WES30060.1 ankyrin repeat domain-containing protein [Varunaivibrio sulfuroxidans]
MMDKTDAATNPTHDLLKIEVVQSEQYSGSDWCAEAFNPDEMFQVGPADFFTNVYEGNVAKLKRQINKANVADYKTKHRDTGLTIAAMQGHNEIAQMLIEAGADINARNKNGDTALTIAALNGNTAIIKMLLKAGADTSVRNRQKMRAVDIATQRLKEFTAAVKALE